ncbi:MAG TPA: YkvA family protein [Pseudolabrys sp.]|nr:YkvA family protein [Pseudolabrys sp.]
MEFARAGFWRRGRKDDSALRRSFWRKTRAVAARIPFVEELLAAYYCAFDRSTPLQVKATLIGAIAYFILPIDAIPDVMPVLGFTDDAAVLATAIKLVAGAITPLHREAARMKLDEISAGR